MKNFSQNNILRILKLKGGMEMSKKSGFTLIELLVVIAIIALLLAILMPSLKIAKKLAQAVVCSAHTKQLSLAWRVYAEDNSDKICYGNVLLGSTPAEQWVQRMAQPGDPGYVSGTEALEREIIGIQQGALFTYTESEKVYHCPADPAYKKFRGMSTLPSETKRSPFRGFTIAGGMNAGPSPGSTVGYKGEKIIKKIGQIVNAGEKYVFLEEAEEGKGGHNWGSWILDSNLAVDSWHDPISVWHGDSSVMGFADGHAETHKWRNDSTKDLANGIIGPGQIVDPDDDLEWMQRRYIPKN